MNNYTGIGNNIVAVHDDTRMRISLIDIRFCDPRDNTDVLLSIVWDRKKRQFDFTGDPELCTPVARQFFDEFGACAMDWLKEHLNASD